jgi:hypothetical protein
MPILLTRQAMLCLNGQKMSRKNNPQKKARTPALRDDHDLDTDDNYLVPHVLPAPAPALPQEALDSDHSTQAAQAAAGIDDDLALTVRIKSKPSRSSSTVLRSAEQVFVDTQVRASSSNALLPTLVVISSFSLTAANRGSCFP